MAAGLDDLVLCEQFIAGDEVTVPVLGSGADARALPVIRIEAPDGNYDYQNKYFTDTTRYLVPCGLPDGEAVVYTHLDVCKRQSCVREASQCTRC